MKSPLTHFILALIGSLSVAAWYVSWYSTVSQKSSDVVNLQNQITAASDNMSRIASTRATLAQIADDEADIQNYFVSDANIVSFINELEALGSEEGAVVSVVSVSKGGSRTLPKLLLTLSVDGTFDAVMRTVGAVEYAPYAISVSMLSVARGVKGGWHADFHITVDSLPAATATSTTQP